MGYVSNTVLSDSNTWSNTTIAGLGVTPGTYTWSWNGGANTFVLTTGAAPVPEPSFYGLPLFLAAACFVGWRKMRI